MITTLIPRSTRSTLSTTLTGALVAMLVASISACAPDASDDGAADSVVVGDGPSVDVTPARADSGRATRTIDTVIWEGSTGGYAVRWTTSDIAVATAASENRRSGASGATILSMRAALDSAMHTGIGSVDTTGADCNDEYDFAVLSAVGSILSVQQRHYSYCEGMPHPTLYSSYTAFDLARNERDGMPGTEASETIGREIALTDLFSEREVLDALLADKLVLKRLAELSKAPEEIVSTDELVGLLEGGADCEYGFERDMLRRWAFHHVEGDRVAVRIGLSHGCEAAQGKLTQIGVLLKIPASIREDLALAASGRRGILMMDAAKRYADRAARITYRYRFVDGEDVAE